MSEGTWAGVPIDLSYCKKTGGIRCKICNEIIATPKGTDTWETVLLAILEHMVLRKYHEHDRVSEQAPNEKAYREIIKQLERDHPNEWALISSGELLVVKPTYQEVLKEIAERGLVGESCYFFKIGKHREEGASSLGW